MYSGKFNAERVLWITVESLYNIIDTNLMHINQYCSTKIFPTGAGLQPCRIKKTICFLKYKRPLKGFVVFILLSLCINCMAQ